MFDISYISKVLIDKTVIDKGVETFQDKIGLSISFSNPLFL